MPSQTVEEILQRVTQRLGRRSNVEGSRNLEGVGLYGGDGAGEKLAPNTDVRELMRYALREALAGGMRQGATENNVRQILRLACDVARQRGSTAEQAIVMLKDALYQLPEAHGRTHSESMAIGARVVTLCIEEYYVSSESS